MKLTVLFLAACLTAASYGVDAAGSYQKVKLTEVQSLVLKPGMMTSARRSKAVPQLQCMRNCKHADDIEVVMCKNIGNDGMGNVNWECTAKPQLPDGLKLGDLEVVCEGYKDPDDPYILAGSCGLEYTLVGSAHDQHSHREKQYDYGGSRHSSKPYRSTSHDNDGWSWITWLIIALVAYTVYRSCFSSRHASGMHMGGGGGGGGGIGGNPPPPPPYSQTASAPSPSSGFSSTTPGYSSSTPGYAGAASSSGPGFWSGMAGGGLMGYMLGNRHNNAYGYGHNAYMQPPHNSFFGSSYGSGYGSGFGGSSGFSSPSPSPSRSSAADSTSYATTRRR